MRNNDKKIAEVSLKVWMPAELRDELLAIAHSRSISLSALVRLALSNYIRSNK